MIELEKKVFGNIKTKVIIGADPPAHPDTKNIFEKELDILLEELKDISYLIPLIFIFSSMMRVTSPSFSPDILFIYIYFLLLR